MSDETLDTAMVLGAQTPVGDLLRCAVGGEESERRVMDNIPKVGDSFRGWTVGKIKYQRYAEIYNTDHKLIARVAMSPQYCEPGDANYGLLCDEDGNDIESESE